jgi:hypothetical protein
MIETEGMVYLNAKDCKGRDLTVNRGKDLIVFQPTDTIRGDAKIFTGSRTGHDSDMNWTVNNSAVLQGFTMNTIDICQTWMCGSVRRGGGCGGKLIGPVMVIEGLFIPCTQYDNRMIRKNRRICRVQKRYSRALSRNDTSRMIRLNGKISRKEIRRKGVIDEYTEECDVVPSGLRVDDLPDPCKRLYDLFKQYGVDNYEDLFYELNKEQMDKYGVKTMGDLQDSIKATTIRGIEKNYNNKSVAFEDVKYYIYNNSRMGWSNVDIFADVKPEDRVTMTVNLKTYKNTDCKLVFRDRRFVIPAESEAGIYMFKDMPKGERVWIVALMYNNGQPYLSLEETTIDDGIHSVKLESLTLKELQEKLKLLDLP